MGQLFSHLFGRYWGRRHARIVMVGLDGAGKTTILYKIKLGEVVRTIPTVGFNVETVVRGGTHLTVWDVGGQEKLRRLWRHYFQNAGGVVFVVDSGDRDRFAEAAAELKRILFECELRDAALLVFANKQDAPLATTPAEVAERMALRDVKDRKWHVQGACALDGTGLTEGFDWLCREISGD
ncbi:hypothetical protein NQ318_002732 [Aromia moschata]|uniref:ADP-ribosylation factor n=1 Tax=Aromia moschata TaxID=1265417 RepID=A0AAV8Y391_9CUCU|nr:hypothetical protein NQ318_002732 [Aromia moschata]